MAQVSTLQLFAAACIFANYAAHHIAACPAAQSPGSLSHALQRPLLPTGLAAGEHGFFTVVPAVAVHVEPVGAKQSRWNADGELLATNHITGRCCTAGLGACVAWADAAGGRAGRWCCSCGCRRFCCLPLVLLVLPCGSRCWMLAYR